MRSHPGEKTTRAARRGFPVSWSIAAIILMVLSTLQKLPCLRLRVDTDVLATAQCYSDIPIFYVDRGLAADFGWLGHLPAGFRNLEYPPLIDLFIEANAKLTHVVMGVSGPELERRASMSSAELFDLPGMASEERAFFIVTCLGLLVAALVSMYIAWTAGWVLGDRVVWLTLTPILILTLTLNWDLVALVATAAALWAWQRGRLTIFGVLVGLGTAAKLFPLVLLAAGLVLAFRARSPRSAVSMTTGFAVASVAANAPLYFSSPDAWAEFWTTSTERAEGFGSAWFALRMVGMPFSADQLGLVLALGMLVSWFAVTGLTWFGFLDPTLTELTILFLLVFFILGKVYSPQYSLWVVLGILFVTRNRWVVAAVAIVETFHYVATWLYIRGFTTPEVGIDKTYWLSMVVRLAVEAGVCVYVVMRMRNRARTGEHAETESAVTPALV